MVLEVKRQNEFAPIKNDDGQTDLPIVNDSPASSLDFIMREAT